jgi:hypothetical protein
MELVVKGKIALLYGPRARTPEISCSTPNFTSSYCISLILCRGRNFLELISALPSQHPDAPETAARIFRENGVVNEDFLDELHSARRTSRFDAIARKSIASPGRRKSVAAFSPRRGTMQNILRSISNEESNQAIEEIHYAKS